MKKVIVLFLVFSYFLSFGQKQDYSIINIVPVSSKKNNGFLTYNVMLGFFSVVTIKKDENLQVKMYSEGRLTLMTLKHDVIDIENGNTYWYIIDPIKNQYQLVDEEKGKELFGKNKETVYVEEDKEYPFIGSPAQFSSQGPSSGTGFLLSENGLIVTNYHVIENAKSIVVKGINGDLSIGYNAKILVSDEKNDLAVLELEDKSVVFEPIPFVIRNKSANTGEEIFVLGYPMKTIMGEEVKLTTGVISSKTGFQGDITSYQVSAPVQGGNSGGPMFDKQGNLTGIVNSKIQGAEGVTYAIKTNYLNTLIDLLPNVPVLNEVNRLEGLDMQNQVKSLSKFVYIIEVNN